jgi:hypothetical protein
MISFISTDFRDRREINEHEDEYAILMRSDRSDKQSSKTAWSEENNLVTIEDLDPQKDLDESWDERSVNEIVGGEFLFNEVDFLSRLERQQLAIHSFVSQ